MDIGLECNERKTNSKFTFVKSPLQTCYQAPVASPLLTTILDSESLILGLVTPEAEVEEIHDKDEIESGLIL